MVLSLCPVGCLRKAKLRQPIEQRLSNVRRKLKEISIVRILFLQYEESLVSSNLNSEQLRFHGVRPNVAINFGSMYVCNLEIIHHFSQG